MFGLGVILPVGIAAVTNDSGFTGCDFNRFRGIARRYLYARTYIRAVD